MANYPRLEAHYHSQDLMTASLRRVLNLTYAWLVDLIGGTEAWDRDYAHIFDPEAAEDFDYVDLGPAQPGQLSFGI